MNDPNDIHNIFNMMFSGGVPGMSGGIRFSSGGGINIMPGVRVMGGGMNGFPHMFHQLQKPPPIIKNIQITIEQAFTGFNMPIEITKITYTNNGQKEEEETIYLSIPAGIDDNEIIILRDRGNSIDDKIRGDIKIIVGVQNNTKLVRHGLDLVYKTNISLKEALCGFSIELDHLNGKKITLNNTVNKSIVKPNFKKVVPQLGMTRENTTGNLIIEFDIQFPDNLTEDQMKLLDTVL
jgi:DnaJ-class molecular chaperone